MKKELKVEVELDKDVEGLITVHANEMKTHDLSIPEISIITQDKASCLPPYLLYEYVTKCTEEEPAKITVVDACAAPGNKTLQLIEYFGKLLAIIIM